MYINVEFLGPIKIQDIKIQANNMQELSDILKQNDNIKQWLDTSAVAVNDNIITDKNYIFKNKDKVSILPPVCGG